MTRILLIRHAETDAVGKRLSGRMPGVSLNETGQAQAQALAARLQHLPLTALYSSPLERALETAAPLAATRSLQPVVSEDFLEMDFGDWTGRAFSEIGEDPQFRLFNLFRSNTRIPGGETMQEAQLRIVRGLEKVCSQHEEGMVAVVSHSDLIKAAVAYYAGIHLDMFQRIEISPASVSVVELYEETARIVLVNDVGGIKI